METKKRVAPKCLTNDQVQEHLQDLIKILRNSDEKLALEFFCTLFTNKERFDIANRLALVRLLESGIAQRAISRDLGVSLCKITRGSSELKRPNSALKRGLTILNSVTRI